MSDRPETPRQREDRLRKLREWAAHHTAAKLLAGPWTTEAIAATLAALLGQGHHRTRKALIIRLTALCTTSYPPSQEALSAFLIESPFFQPSQDHPVPAVLDAPRFTPAAPFKECAIPVLTTLGELADWLKLSIDRLDWLADHKRGHSRARETPLQHYHYAFVAKRNGKLRLIEAPKRQLKAIQRRILREILSAVPVHPGAHGFVAGRSCISGAQRHAGEAMVATFDLAQFFPSIGLSRVHGLFRSLGYPHAVAQRLAGLCVTITPSSICRRLPDARAQAIHSRPHLPQGAPTSPALTNLLAFALDRRLDGLARAAGANYTRYADDLAFSGDAGFAIGLDRFRDTVEAILDEEGFRLNAAKTRAMPRSTRQRVTGIVVNEHCNLARDEFDRLKAILHNCVRDGAAAQNRVGVPDFRRHLDGKISWAEQLNPSRGTKLRRLFDAIDWGSEA